MGQTLSEPVVEKHSSSGGDDRLIYGVSAMQVRPNPAIHVAAISGILFANF